MKRLLLIVLLLYSSISFSSTSLIYVSEKAWEALTVEEKRKIQKKHTVSLVSPESFGKIVDVQSLNRSTSATQDGARLGEALASAQYIDRSFKQSYDDYSSMGHLGAILLGGLVGSTLDSGAVSKYQFRYTVENGNGEINIHNITSAEPFHLSTGLCVQLPSLELQKNQAVCSQTVESLLSDYAAKEKIINKQKLVQLPSKKTREKTINEELVNCQLGSLSPVLTTVNKCKSINGVIVK